ncbi:hypothetical protein BTHE68_06100 [Burkholderia sp. THE68]|nr:hypothetical protein BTHE68_06100 [Burkholderia sp. THE68]
MQKAVRREQFRTDHEFAAQLALIERNQLHAEQVGQAAFLAVAQEIEGDVGAECGHECGRVEELNLAWPFGQHAGCITFADNINARIMHLFSSRRNRARWGVRALNKIQDTS